MLKCKKDAETQEAATAALKEEGKTGQEATKKQTKKGQEALLKWKACIVDIK